MSLRTVETMISSLPPEAYLGHAVTFTASDLTIDASNLLDQLAANNLRTGSAGKRIRRIDAFKRASNEIATTFPRHPLRQDSLVVKAVGQDRQESHRLVILERRTHRTQVSRPRVDTYTIWRIMYDRGVRQPDGTWRDDFISVEEQPSDVALSPVQKAWISQAIGEDGAALRRRFEHHSAHLDTNGARRFVRTYLTQLDAINLKGTNSGGLYFVPRYHADELCRLASLVNSFGSDMHLIPVLNDASQRSFLSATFAAELSDALGTVAYEIDRIVSDEARTITAATLTQFDARVADAHVTLGRYEQLLDRQLPAARDSVRRFTEQVRQLDTRVQTRRSLHR